MGKPLTIQEDDDQKIEELKVYFGAVSKIAVVRMALDLLEQERVRQEKSKRWVKAVHAVRGSSASTNKEFRKGSSVSKKVS